MAFLFFQIILLLHFSNVLCQTSGVRCLSCHNAKTPEDCDNWVTCGLGEICFAREIISVHGEQAFHLGCEGKTRCDLFINAKILIGKRDLDSNPEDTSSLTEEWDDSRCYQCCVQNDCNSRLCSSFLHTQSNTPNMGPSPSSCPPTFVKGPGSCYYFGNWSVSWENARLDCSRRGADLVSIDTQTEQDFIAQHLNSSDPSSVAKVGYWTGGFYVYALKEYAWADLNKLTYSAWGPKEPVASSYMYNNRVAMLNPSSHKGYIDWAWSAKAHGTALGFICETDFI